MSTPGPQVKLHPHTLTPYPVPLATTHTRASLRSLCEARGSWNAQVVAGVKKPLHRTPRQASPRAACGTALADLGEACPAHIATWRSTSTCCCHQALEWIEFKPTGGRGWYWLGNSAAHMWTHKVDTRARTQHTRPTARARRAATHRQRTGRSDAHPNTERLATSCVEGAQRAPAAGISLSDATSTSTQCTGALDSSSSAWMLGVMLFMPLLPLLLQSCCAARQLMPSAGTWGRAMSVQQVSGCLPGCSSPGARAGLQRGVWHGTLAACEMA
jgi:hypothetical protein